MYIKAIKNLYNGRFITKSPYTYSEIQWLDENVTAPTDAEIQAEVTRMQAEHQETQYQRDRVAEYPSIQEQMDMQYWDAINGTTTWQDAINATKTKYPKGA